ncbi:MAG: polymerase subunit delta, polymerase subunit delta protein [Patescibacteria group bacterium]|nr:polymerase subunit delta, polymerase subunit delta protein [Patescibacteria group bacterium]
MTFFFYGPNAYALRQQLNKMVEAYRAKAGSDFGLERIDGSGVKPRELLATLQAAPFLAASRLVIVEGVAGNKTAGDKLEDLLARVPASTVAVFVEREVDQRTKAFKALKKADKVVKFEPLEGPRLLGWIRAEVERLGGSIEPVVLRELVDLAGNDQWRLSEEVQKLVNYSPRVTVEVVQQLVAPSVERSIFELVEAMTLGRPGVALSGYHALLRQKESEIYVLTMVQWQLRNLLLAKTAPAAMAPSDLARAVGMSPYVAGKMAAAQNGLSQEALETAYKAAADCEYDIKTGRIKAEAAVERLIWHVAEGVKR